MSKIHVAAVRPKVFGEIMAGRRAFVVRRNTDVEVGDMLRLEEFDQDTPRYTGAVMLKHVTSISTDGDEGLAPGFVVLGLGDHP